MHRLKQVYDYYWVDVFSEQAFGGNPLVVFPNAEGLDGITMQKIAREFNVSETTFVCTHTEPKSEPKAVPERPEYVVRIFTPAKEIPFAGHPTLGTAWVMRERHGLKSQGLNLIEGVGTVPVVFCPDGSLELELAIAPEYQTMPISSSELAEFLGLSEAELGAGDLQPEIVSCGLPYTLVPLAGLASIQKARYVWPGEHPLLQRYPALREVYLICPETQSPDCDFHVRMFAPYVGVPEDPATGSAAVTLGAYFKKHRSTESSWILEQGIEMGRPSRLYIRSENESIFVRGYVRLFAQGQIEI